MKTKKMMMTVVMTIILAAVVFSSCTTDVDLCYNPEHPHQAKVKYEFNWGSYAKDIAADDSMYVIADRVINHWKAAMIVSPNDPVRGRFVFNGPATADENNQSKPETPGTTPDTPADEDVEEELPGDGPVDGGTLASPRREIIASTRAGNGENTPDSDKESAPRPAVPQTGTLTEFQIRPGDYKFVTFSSDITSLNYQKVMDYLTDDTNEKSLQGISVEYKTYDKDNNQDKLKMRTVDWQDYNSYADYLQPDMKKVFFDSIASINIPSNGTVVCKFTPKPITQEIDVYFTVKKDIIKEKFTIDSVLVDISGIPLEINIANGYLQIARTGKMMFEMLPDGKTKWDDWKTYDKDENSSPIRLHGKINVPSLVQNNNPKANTGPGILQVLLFTSVLAYELQPNGEPDYDRPIYQKDENGDYKIGENGKPIQARQPKKIQGKINLYNTLRTANLMTVTSDGLNAVRNGAKGKLDIVADIVIDGSDIRKNTDDTGGIDQWLPCGDEILPPPIDI